MSGFSLRVAFVVMKLKLALQDQRIFKIKGLSITCDDKHSSECGRKFDN